MSRIDMGKPGAHEVTSCVEAHLKNDKAESMIQYIEACNQLVMKYKPEIDFIEDMFSRLRKQKVDFFEKSIPNIKKNLEKEGIPKELINDWLCEIKDNGLNSFKASESILQEFAIASVGELKEKIREIVDA